jgi:predicted Na+-dependent transporter
MQTRTIPSLLSSLKASYESFDRIITRRQNLLSFLVVRFVLMSGLVVGFSWWALNLSP